jgi:DNA-binding transcriptional ArsR family regulator
MGRTEWEDVASDGERVHSVVRTLSQPRPASWIADTALVPISTAQKHLSELADAGVVEAVDDGGERRYAPNPGYEREQEIRRLAEEHDRDDLARLRQELTECAGQSEEQERRLIEYRLGLVDNAIEWLDGRD